MTFFEHLALLFQLAFRSLFSRKVKSLIVGSIMFFGTVLVVAGNALVDSVAKSMSKSIVSSVAGHIQVFAADAKDQLDLFPAMSLFDYDNGTIPNFHPVREALLTLPNVEAVIPMGPDKALLNFGNEFDRVLGDMREAVKAGNHARLKDLTAQIRSMAELLKKDLVTMRTLAADPARVDQGMEDVKKILSDDFWGDFAKEPLTALEFMENQIAPLSFQVRQTFLFYLGTDLDRFQKYFDLFEIADGEKVPPGHRGFLFSKRMYEEQVKHFAARILDVLKENLESGSTIADDKNIQDRVGRLVRQYKRILYQLDPGEVAIVEPALQKFLGEPDKSLEELIPEFLQVTDANFPERYQFFYEHIAPYLILYDIQIGDMLTIRTFTKSGYLKAANVKVYGTFRFKGLEGSDLAGIYNLMDLMTFRDLYGYMTTEKRKELRELKRQMQVQEVNRETAEEELFGGSTDIMESDQDTGGFDEFTGVDLARAGETFEDLASRTYTSLEIEDGVCVNAAIILKNPAKLPETMGDIAKLNEDRGLGIKAIDWQTAAGVVGQYITMIRLILFVAIFIIFSVAIVIINNSMIMATLERVTEIGTMRAIGAKKRLILGLFILETILLGLLAGGAGAIAGSGLIHILGAKGIPAPNEVMVFLFAGPKLYPTVALWHMGLGIGVILVVSILATLYPAFLAMRIQPVTAMQSSE